MFSSLVGCAGWDREISSRKRQKNQTREYDGRQKRQQGHHAKADSEDKNLNTNQTPYDDGIDFLSQKIEVRQRA